MYPGMMGWWKHAHRHGGSCGEEAGAGPCGAGGWHGRGGRQRAEEAYAAPDHEGDGQFGVRRPLRFLAHKLELEDEQVSELARILSDLKTERAQAAVDQRRSTAAIADAVAAEAFDEGKLTAAVGERVKTAEHLRDAVVKAVGRIYAVLQPDQRQRLAYLIRTGVLVI